MKLKFILGFCLLGMFVSSCGNSQYLAKSSHSSEQNQTSKNPSKSSPNAQNNMVFIGRDDVFKQSLHPLDTVKDIDPITVRLQLKYFKFKHLIDVDSNEIITFQLKNTSDLIVFNHTVGFKFHRIVLNDNGKIKHFIKHDVFVLNNGKWEKIENGYLSESFINESNNTSLNASTSVKSTNYDYFIKYNYSK